MGDRATPNAWPDREAMVRLIGEHKGSIAGVARATGFAPTSVSHHVASDAVLAAALDEARGGVAPAVTVERDRHVTSTDPAEWGDTRALLERRGLRLEDWIITRARVNEWGDPAALNTQLRVDVAPRIGLLMPARTDGWKAPKVRARKSSGPELVAFMGDHHVPHHDEQLHEAVCAWLKEFQPDRIIVLGDLLDYDGVSRHRKEPTWAATMQDTIDAGYRVLRSYRDLCPNARIEALSGNHEHRLRNAVLDQIAAIHGLTRAEGDEEHPVLSTPFLLRMDELNIAWTGGDGSYEHDQILITPELAARHGWIARKGSGASALGTLNHLRHSVAIGHCHRQSIVHHTAHSITGEPKTLAGVEVGTLAEIRGGLSYSVNPDWQQGFATASVWPDGLFHMDLATYTAGRLMWRGWDYRP